MATGYVLQNAKGEGRPRFSKGQTGLRDAPWLSKMAFVRTEMLIQKTLLAHFFLNRAQLAVRYHFLPPFWPFLASERARLGPGMPKHCLSDTDTYALQRCSYDLVCTQRNGPSVSH